MRAERVDSIIQGCRPRMSKHCQECTAPRRACARRPKLFGRVQSSARGQANKTSADGRDCESALGGKADTPFAGKAERTAKVAIEERYECLACCRRTKALHAGPLQDTKPGTASTGPLIGSHTDLGQV